MPTPNVMVWQIKIQNIMFFKCAHSLGKVLFTNYFYATYSNATVQFKPDWCQYFTLTPLLGDTNDFQYLGEPPHTIQTLET